MTALIIPATSVAVSGDDGPDRTYAHALWLVRGGRVLQLPVAAGETDLEIDETAPVQRVALDRKRGRLWIYSGGNLAAYDLDGRQLHQARVVPAAQAAWDRLPLPHPFLHLAIRPDHGLWLLRGRSLLLIAPGGTVEARKPLAGGVLCAAADPDARRLWVAHPFSVSAFDAAGSRVAHLATFPHRVRALVPGGGGLWLAGPHALRLLDMSGAVLQQYPSVHARSLARDGRGGLWAASRVTLWRIDAAGQIAAVYRMRPVVGGDARHTWAVDPADGTVWMAAGRIVRHIGRDGALLGQKTLFGMPPRLLDRLSGVAVYVDTFPPTLRVESPVRDVFLATHRPVIRLGYDDNGVGVDPSTIRAKDGGSVLALDCSADRTGAHCTPASDIPDGPVVLAVSVADFAGNRSGSVEVSFTVDTIPPRITVNGPADGAWVNDPHPTLSGSVSEPATLTLDGNSLGLDVHHAFRHRLDLADGSNALRLVAVDRAGNRTADRLTVHLDTVPPDPPPARTVTVGMPSQGQVTVTGDRGSVPARMKVVVTNLDTGDRASTAASGDGSFGVSIAAGAGQSLRIRSVDRAGNVSDPLDEPVGPPDPAEVAPPIDPTVSASMAETTAFLYAGSNPVQTGVAAGTIEPRRTAVIRGEVISRDGAPLPGVLVTVRGHPELGQTLTRGDGRYDLVVNGGGTLVLRYSHKGYLTARRRLHANWQSYREAPTVALVRPDAHATPVSFGATSVAQVAEGSVETDAAGKRRAVVVFAPGTRATMKMPDGSTRGLDGGEVRVTEYTVGANGRKAMPAQLPDMSGYTYAVNLRIDQATAAGAMRVDFNEPVRLYVRNFLGFPVGGVAPLGWYDLTRSRWVPADNGRIIGVLADDADGCALLDIDGSGQPAGKEALQSLDIDHAEACRIGHRYAPGRSFWRVAVHHFTTFDINWPIGAPPGSVPPIGQPPAAGHDTVDNGQDDDCPGCRIDAQAQVLGQSIAIAGTPYELVYSSDRAPGYAAARTIDIPITGDSVPDTLLGVNLTIQVAGQVVHRRFGPEAGQSYRLHWNGRDGFGRRVHGFATANVVVSYVYPAVYLNPNPVFRSFDVPPVKRQQVGPAFVMTSRVVSLSRSWMLSLRSGMPDSAALGGWLLNVHHHYDPDAHVLFTGDGTHRYADATGLMVRTVVGGGSKAPDDVPARQARLVQPEDVALDGAGDLFIASKSQGVMEVTPDGRIHTLSPNVPSPDSLAVGPSGDLYAGSTDKDRLYHLVPDVSSQAIAGNGKPCRVVMHTCGDGVPALSAGVTPESVSVARDGTIYVLHADDWDGAHHVREITPDGIIRTIHSFGGAPWQGTYASAVYADPLGGIEFGGWLGAVFRMRGGTVTRFARAEWGSWTFDGDGGPATEAHFRFIYDFKRGPDGSMYVLDEGRVRRITPDGIVHTIGGVGKTCRYYRNRCGDQGPALDARLTTWPRGGLGVGNDGTIYVSDWYTGRVRALGPSFPGRGQGGIVVPSRDGSELYYFTPDGRHLRTVSATTGAVLYRFGYDDAGRLVSVTDGGGNVTRIQRDSTGRALAIIAPDRQKTTLQLDAAGHLVQVTDPSGGRWSAGYGDAGLLTAFRDRNGNEGAYAYGDLGRLTRVREPTGIRWTLRRTILPDDGYRVSLATGNGLTQSFAVHPLPNGGRRLVHAFPGGTRQTRTYNGDGSSEIDEPDGTVRISRRSSDPRFGGRLLFPASTTVTTPSGLTRTRKISREAVTEQPDTLKLGVQTDTITVNARRYKRILDVTDHTLSVTTPMGRTIHGTLDGQGRISSLQVGDLAAVRYGRDGRGRLVSVTRGSGTGARKVSMGYGSNGYLASVSDPDGRTVQFQRDALGRVTSDTRPDGSQILFRYDASGNVTAIAPPGRPAHELAYDSHDDLASYAPPAIAGSRDATVYHYDASHRLTSVDYPDGVTATLDYGSGDRLVGVETPRGTETYQYDRDTGRLTRIAGGGETLDFAWDGFLPTTQSWSGAVSGSVGFAWDDNFRVTGVTVAGNDIARAYDKDGLLTKAGQLTLTRGATDGMVDATALGNIVGMRQYDKFGALSAVTATYQGTALYSDRYQRDATGRIVSRTETIGGVKHSYDYAYDKNGRLLQVRADDMVADTYAYDANGNRLSHSGTMATYDDRDRLLTYGSTSYRYSARGPLSQKTDAAGTTSYDYDVLGNLREVRLPDGRTIDYVIDGRNRRIGKEIDGKLVRGFLYKDQLNPVAELDGAGNVVTRFVYGSRANVPAYMIRNGNTYRIISDHLGSVRLVVNASTGKVVQRMDYSPFGKVLRDTNPGFQPFGFAGGIYDPDTGLVRFGARDYDAETGRWTARDSILFAGGNPNLYGYSLNDPVDFRDPRGMFCLKNIVPRAANFLRQHGFVELTFNAGYGIGVSASVEVTRKGISAYGGIGAGLGYGVSLSGGMQAGSSSGWQLRGSVSGGELVGGEVSGTVSQRGLAASGGLGAGLGAGATVTGGYETTIVPFDNPGAAQPTSPDGCGCA